MSGWSERVMGQKGFFDLERSRLEAISIKGDRLEIIKKMLRWHFRAAIEAVTETRPEKRKSNARPNGKER